MPPLNENINNPGLVEIANQGQPKAPDGGTLAPTFFDVSVKNQVAPPVIASNLLPATDEPLNPTLPALVGVPPIASNADFPEEVSQDRVPSAPLEVTVELAGCSLVDLTAGNLGITIMLSDGSSNFGIVNLAALQLPGPAFYANFLFVMGSPIPSGLFIVSCHFVAPSFSGPALTSVKLAVQTQGQSMGQMIPQFEGISGVDATFQYLSPLSSDPSAPAPGYLISQAGSTQINAAEAVVSFAVGATTPDGTFISATDYNGGGAPTSTTQNVKLSFSPKVPFTSYGISLAGRPLYVSSIDDSRTIRVMADDYLVIANLDASGKNPLFPIPGLSLGDLLSFDSARHGGEEISQINLYGTLEIIPNNPAQNGVPSDSLDVIIFLDGCDFGALTAGFIAVLIQLNDGTTYAAFIGLPTLQAQGAVRSARLVVPMVNPVPLGFFIVFCRLVTGPFAGPGLVSAKLAIQTQSSADGSLIPLTNGAPGITIQFDYLLPPPTDPTQIGGPVVNVNVSDQVLVNGTPINVFP